MRKCFVVGAAILMGLALFLSLGYGPISLTPVETAHYLRKILGGSGGSIEEDVLLYIRIPHLLLSFFIGVGLAVCGVVMQAVMRNPLADPYLLGISSGASLGAVLAISLGISAIGSFDGVGLFAFVGAATVSMAILCISSITGKGGSLTLLLSGFALNAACSAAVSFLITLMADSSKTRTVQFWMMGQLRMDSWLSIGVIGCLVTAGTLFFMSQRRMLDLMIIGDTLSLTLGAKLSVYRKWYIAVTALLVGSLVYAAGMIGFVGILVPHAVRLFTGSSHGHLIPFSALVGGVFLSWADIWGRNLLPGLEIPIGIMAALAGAPFFVWMLLRRKYVTL